MSILKYIIFPAAVSALLLTGCNRESAKEELGTDSEQLGQPDVVRLTALQMQNAEIALGNPTIRKVNTVIKLNGVVEVSHDSKVFVSNPFGGFVTNTMILPGSQVKRGDILLTMEDPKYIEMQQDYLMAKSRLKFLEADYSRQQELNQDKSISDKVYQQTLSDYTSQQVLVKSLEEKLGLLHIRPTALSESTLSRTIKIHAPLDGYVSAIYARVGKYSNSTDPLLELTDEKTLHASLTIFEKDLPYVKVGQRLKITTPSRPADEYISTVHTVNRTFNSERSSEIHCDFENRDKHLHPGMFITAELAVAEAEVLAVPEDAIVSWGNQRFVFITDDQETFRMLPVETGMSSDGFVEIKDDLRNKTLVTQNAYSLLMKLKGGDE